MDNFVKKKAIIYKCSGCWYQVEKCGDNNDWNKHLIIDYFNNNGIRDMNI